MWNSVKIAKDQSEKVKNIVETTKIDENIYNGERKIYSNSKMFMDEASVKECILNLKIKYFLLYT